MNKNFFYLLAAMLIIGIKISGQSSPVMYFCESYGEYGEVGISSSFTVGQVTIMVKNSQPLDLRKVFIQFEKFNPDSSSFEFYKRFTYNISPKMKYVYFKPNKVSDLSFDEPGIYRVYLLSDKEEAVTSALLEIVPVRQ